MRIVHLSASVSRQAGGVFHAMRELSSALDARGYDVTVVGLKDAASAAERIDWAPVPVETVPVRGPGQFGYAPTLHGVLHGLRPDLLHVHGLWMYPSVASLDWTRMTRRPIVISPHGMLDPWAIRNSRWKKWLATIAFERAHLHRAAVLHALTASERDAIRAFGLKNPIAVVPNGVVLPGSSRGPVPWRDSIPPEARVLLFLGRIHPKKGLAELIEGLSRVVSEAPLRRWHLAVVGWDDGGHEGGLRAQAEELGLGDRVHFLGALYGAEKDAALAHANAFVLPSHSEGLPMAVLEAWAHGLPVVMTAACNLPAGFEVGAALEVSPNPESIATGLLGVMSMAAEERSAMGMRGRQLISSKYTWDQAASSMHDAYEWILDGMEVRGAPACIQFAR